jgi:hypothetical protein
MFLETIVSDFSADNGKIFGHLLLQDNFRLMAEKLVFTYRFVCSDPSRRPSSCKSLSLFLVPFGSDYAFKSPYWYSCVRRVRHKGL